MKDLLKLFLPNTLQYFCPGRFALLSLSSLATNDVDDLHPEKECNNGQASDLRKVIRFQCDKRWELTTLSQVALSTTGGQQKS